MVDENGHSNNATSRGGEQTLTSVHRHCPVQEGEERRSKKMRVVCLLDMMGGKPSSHFNDGSVSHTLTCGRASTNDIHVVCYYARRRKA